MPIMLGRAVSAFNASSLYRTGDMAHAVVEDYFDESIAAPKEAPVRPKGNRVVRNKRELVC